MSTLPRKPLLWSYFAEGDVSAQVVSCCVYDMQYLFYYWADPVVNLLLLKFSTYKRHM